jgi:hypothetical protein
VNAIENNVNIEWIHICISRTDCGIFASVSRIAGQAASATFQSLARWSEQIQIVPAADFVAPI